MGQNENDIARGMLLDKGWKPDGRGGYTLRTVHGVASFGRGADGVLRVSLAGQTHVVTSRRPTFDHAEGFVKQVLLAKHAAGAKGSSGRAAATATNVEAHAWERGPRGGRFYRNEAGQKVYESTLKGKK